MDISVVIPLYNKELYIRRAIESVLQQNAAPNEIIVIDDGSTDQSADEVRKISDPRIRLIQQQNAGECASRNRGVDNASNNLVAFLDADDEWKPDFLTHISRLYINFPDCGAYATSYEIVDPGGINSYPCINKVPPAPWIGIIPNLIEMLPDSPPFFPSSIAFSKIAYHVLGGFPEGIKRAGDTMMWIRLGVLYPIAFSPSYQAIYHRDAENRVCTIFPSEKEEVCATLIENMLKNQEIPHGLIEDLKDYYIFIQISKAGEMVRDGHMKIARAILKKAKNNTKYQREWLWWYFWSFVPTTLMKFILRVRAN